MDAQTVLLTANTETVYALGHLYLKDDGPTVVDAPPKMLGFAMDALQRYLVDIGPLGPDKAKGGKYLFLPPGYADAVPAGILSSDSPTYVVGFGMRGFQENGKTDAAVALMKQTKIYPLAKAANPAPTSSSTAPGRRSTRSNPIRSGSSRCCRSSSTRSRRKCSRRWSASTCRRSASRRESRSIPTPRRKTLLTEAVRAGQAMARANTFASRGSR